MAKRVKYDFNPIADNPDIQISSRTRRRKALSEVKKFVVDAVLDFVLDGNSPVKNRGRFKRLTENYADDQKDGNRTPNLTLTSDMLDSLHVKTLRGNALRLTVGVTQNAKADGHNNHSGDSNLPIRRFIPTQNEDFKRQITSGITDILLRFEDEE